MRIGLHICRGNWSKQEEVLLKGDYARLLPALQPMQIDQFVLEYATPRAGDIDVVGKHLADRELGLGVVNPRTDEVEPVEYIVAKAEKALEYYRPDQLFLNTDCGFGCFASRSVNVEEVAFQKLCAIVEAAKILRSRFG
ncbi:Cobalamin-independent synthase, Catalytic domain [Desulfopila aestuarii DSM 18488]|uniref:Cobalamin-independent synthase, Catalytic domain n=1 Tax=Desulfopila aestuarii DSM 18488 TaxID=1121416 RepID=A0A1M7XVL9_9BACT|nr:Cobalamin-independent synthase, Catalytic domain [Desulfopila aestuarii DSM 18488]